MEEIILKITDLTKKYSNKAVVDNLNIEIRKGEIFGLLGPNGAGKSTTMNMICSIVRPTAGSIELLGKNPWKQKKEVIHKIGYIPQELAIHGSLKAWENVELFTSLYGIKGAQLKESVDESLEYVGLLEKKQEFAKNFSGGMKRRLNIACGTSEELKKLMSNGDDNITLEEVFLTLTGKKLRDAKILIAISQISRYNRSSMKKGVSADGEYKEIDSWNRREGSISCSGF